MSANDRQEGGDHYGLGEYQHWDWVSDTKMHYLPATASKYIYRRKDDREEDLKKAVHYIDKAEERHITGASGTNRMDSFWKFVTLNDVCMVDAMILFYIMEGQWNVARAAIVALPPEASTDRSGASEPMGGVGSTHFKPSDAPPQ